MEGLELDLGGESREGLLIGRLRSVRRVSLCGLSKWKDEIATWAGEEGGRSRLEWEVCVHVVMARRRVDSRVQAAGVNSGVTRV